jgi:hypothetical protein
MVQIRQGALVVSNIPRFAEYAAAFEQSFASDDWSHVAPFFADDAVYEVTLEPPMGGCFEGRDSVLEYFKFVLDGFDRRFDSREIALTEGPTDRGDAVWIRGSATYRKAGVPDLVLVLEETATFDNGLIRRLEDRYEPEMKQHIEDYASRYGAKLGLGI